jgi:hypothetical protein
MGYETCIGIAHIDFASLPEQEQREKTTGRQEFHAAHQHMKVQTTDTCCIQLLGATLSSLVEYPLSHQFW